MTGARTSTSAVILEEDPKSLCLKISALLSAKRVEPEANSDAGEGIPSNTSTIESTSTKDGAHKARRPITDFLFFRDSITDSAKLSLELKHARATDLPHLKDPVYRDQLET